MSVNGTESGITDSMTATISSKKNDMISELVDRVVQLETQRDNENSEYLLIIQNKNQEIDQLNTRLKELTSENQSTQSSLLNEVDFNSSLQREILSPSIERLTDELIQTKSELSSLKGELSSTKSLLETCTQNSKNIERDLADLSLVRNELLQEVDSFKEKLLHSQNSRDVLQSKYLAVCVDFNKLSQLFEVKTSSVLETSKQHDLEVKKFETQKLLQDDLLHKMEKKYKDVIDKLTESGRLLQDTLSIRDAEIVALRKEISDAQNTIEKRIWEVEKLAGAEIDCIRQECFERHKLDLETKVSLYELQSREIIDEIHEILGSK